MSAEITIVPVVTLSGPEKADWTQEREDAVDVSAYTEAAVVITAYAGDVNNGPTTVTLQTAVDNNEGEYATLVELESYAAQFEFPDTTMVYLQGPGIAGDEGVCTGFARYLRARVEQDDASTITLGIKAILKP